MRPPLSRTFPPTCGSRSQTKPVPQAYPIAGTTWVLLYKDQSDVAQGKLVTAFVEWAITDGQKYANDLDYAVLAKNLVQKSQAALRTVKCGGKSCLQEVGIRRSVIWHSAATLSSRSHMTTVTAKLTDNAAQEKKARIGRGDRIYHVLIKAMVWRGACDLRRRLRRRGHRRMAGHEAVRPRLLGPHRLGSSTPGFRSVAFYGRARSSSLSAQWSSPEGSG